MAAATAGREGDRAIWSGSPEEAANPLLAGWQSVYGPDAPFNTYERHDWPDDAFNRRRELSAAFSFAVPTDEALDAIAALGPVVEIGAGTGYWAKLLRWRGVDVLAFDLLGDAHRKWFPHGTLTDVERGGVEKAAQHADRTLLLVWPPYDETMAFGAATAYYEADGQRLVYVGEGSGGCCADDRFFGVIGDCWRCECDDEVCDHPGQQWHKVRDIAIPQWDGIHDWMGVYEAIRSA